jgi:processive 1,2-diacylglycerol beta-glucosyltransferase
LLAAARHSDRTLKLIIEFQPDLIISTQTTSSAVIAYLKKRKLYNGLFAIAFSDFHYHDFWRYAEADYYLVNIEEQKTELVGHEVLADRISICGMSLVNRSVKNKDQILIELGIPEDARVILVGSGSQAVVFPWVIADELAKMTVADKNLFIILLSGTNKELQQELSERYNNNQIKILSYYQPLDELYKIADLFVTKPGGLSVAEALSYDLPMIITPPQKEALFCKKKSWLNINSPL